MGMRLKGMVQISFCSEIRWWWWSRDSVNIVNSMEWYTFNR